MLIALVAILAFLLVLFMVLKVVAALVGLVWLLLIATLCGAIAESLLHYREGGIAATTGVGLIGAVIGVVIAKVLHFPTLVSIGHLPVLWTVVGSIVLVSGLKVVTPNRRLQGRRDVAPW
jgi:uncharacterized membrane protein YeaQ/YmgE (transglycosylase-associated protein family)